MKTKKEPGIDRKTAGKKQIENVAKKSQAIRKNKSVIYESAKEQTNVVSDESVSSVVKSSGTSDSSDSGKIAGSQVTPQTQKNISQGGIENIISKLYESLADRSFKDSDIEAVLPNLSKEKRVDVLNQLLIKEQIEVFKDNNQLAYKWKTKEKKKNNKDDKEPDELSGLDGEEKIVFRIIKEVGNKGIWMRDIRFKSNILPNQLNKVLKSLESKKVVKAVKSVSAYKKKVYMLYDLEPDNTLTGGSWYQDQDFESEFVDVLNEQCYRFLLEMKKKHNQAKDDKNGPLVLRNMCSVIPKDVCKFITDLGISKIPLSELDIKSILETLVYDGKVERKINASGLSSYRAIECLYPATGVVAIPCSVCRIIQDCHELPQITSEKCTYLDEWLNKTEPLPLKLETVKPQKKNHQFSLLFKGVRGKDRWGTFDIQWSKKGPKKIYLTKKHVNIGSVNSETTISDKSRSELVKSAVVNKERVNEIVSQKQTDNLSKEEVLESWRQKIMQQLGEKGRKEIKMGKGSISSENTAHVSM